MKKLKRISDTEESLIEVTRKYGEAAVISELSTYLSNGGKSEILQAMLYALLPYSFYSLDDLVSEGAVSTEDCEDIKQAIKQGRSVLVTGDGNSVLMLQALLWQYTGVSSFGEVLTLEYAPRFDFRGGGDTEGIYSYNISLISATDLFSLLSKKWGYVGLGAIDSSDMLALLNTLLSKGAPFMASVPCETSFDLENHIAQLWGKEDLGFFDSKLWQEAVVIETRVTDGIVKFNLERY